MGKRVDNDSTMEVSASQLVPDRPRAPARPARDNPANDVSTWKQSVVTADQFAPPARPRTSRAPLWIAIGFIVATAVAAAAYIAMT